MYKRQASNSAYESSASGFRGTVKLPSTPKITGLRRAENQLFHRMLNHPMILNDYRTVSYTHLDVYKRQHEGLVESVIREVEEETGLTIKNPKLVGMKHFYTTDNERYLVFLYRTSDFEGEIHSTEEGEVRWVAREDVPKMDLAYDMLNLLRVFEEDNLSELFYRERLEDDFVREFW